ncbi:MAG: aldo/keto reductase [Gammaproteobacteria bacterium]|nr:aldo/keto reductase [Gammaproteobacteria bacterium]
MTALERRPLGQTGLEVSCLGLGTVKIGRNQGVKYPNGFELPDDSSVSSLLVQAETLGINLLDTAPAYGSSEERLGKLLRDRERWIICSKVGEEFHNGKSTFEFSASHVRSSVERSLRRLNTEWLDIVLVHSDGNDLAIIEESDCLEELQKLKDRGLINSYGMSTKTVEGGLQAVQQTDVVMVTYNPLAQDDTAVIDKAAALGKGVLIKKGLLSGHLDSLAEKAVDPIEKSLRFIFEKQGISSVIIGTINPRHLSQNVQSAIKVMSES